MKTVIKNGSAKSDPHCRKYLSNGKCIFRRTYRSEGEIVKDYLISDAVIFHRVYSNNQSVKG